MGILASPLKETTCSAVRFTLLILTATAVLASGCGKQQPPPPPLPPALFSLPLSRTVVDWDEFSGRLESPQVVTLSARVSGVVTQASFAEGSLVKAGDLLFVIDERPYQAELQSKEADILSSQAQLSQAQARFNRYEGLKGSSAISAETYDQAVATLLQAKARLASAQAARDIAKLNLEWTHVQAPITGRISKRLITEGNLVTGGTAQATTLTTITSVNPMYAYFNVPESSFVRYKLLIKERKNSNLPELLPCAVQLEQEKSFDRQGEINFIDNRVDRNTGTVEMRCSVPNQDGTLASGLFARTRVPGSEPYQALLIPDAAIGTDQNTRFVLTVDPDNTIERKTVERGRLFGTLRAIPSGLEPGDRVVIQGLQQLRKGTKVEPKETSIGEAPVAALAPFLASDSGSKPSQNSSTVQAS